MSSTVLQGEDERRVAEVTDLIQHLIRNACVNTGDVTSGHEDRSVDVLQQFLTEPATAGGPPPSMDLQTYEPAPGRASLVARIEGRDPAAPSLMFMGHTDVVPANADRWQRDPFGGELVDGVVWGRGAVDMLNLTSSMAVAFRDIARSGWRPEGTLIYLAVADEEAGGALGAKWLLDNDPDAIRVDQVITELGGARIDLGGGPRLPVCVTEKGPFWAELTVKGTPGHGSMPFRSDNALTKASEIVGRLAAFRPPARMHEVWRRFVAGLDVPDELSSLLTDSAQLDAMLETSEDTGVASFVHACTHTTFAPTMMQSGVKMNVIPDTAVLTVDIRVLPGQDRAEVQGLLREAIGEDLWSEVAVEFQFEHEASGSPVDTPLWDALQRGAEKVVPGAINVPYILTGSTDSRFLRELGAVCYGYGAYSEQVVMTEYRRMFHGDDERIDQESLRRSVVLWDLVARDLLGA